ncbi:hypothetical protein ACFW6V_29375 [Streptomyces sp. NPDC058734]|uniref:hypothetical protein n=1 Tax=Streptomyces sp. NPDC058734 TaxID=3346615 RepID=UPI0036B3F33F
MPERTHLTQLDEALRHARADTRVSGGLAYAVRRLNDSRAHHIMTGAARLAIAQRYAVDILDWTDEADELIRDLLTAMPEITSDVTRREYALLLQAPART